MPEAAVGQEVRGGNVQTGPLDPGTYAEITKAFGHLGALNVNNAASTRLILLAYSRSKKVRRAVSQALALVATSTQSVEEDVA